MSTMKDRLGVTTEPSGNTVSQLLGVPLTAGGASFAIAGTAPNILTAGITAPDIPRSVNVAFNAAWDGGDVTIEGRNDSGGIVSQTYASAPGGSVLGVVPFRTITRVTKTVVGASATTAVGTYANQLGLARILAQAAGVITADGVTDATATWGTANSTVIPSGALPNGARTYAVIYPSGGPS